jgi:hypothetical protein
MYPNAVIPFQSIDRVEKGYFLVMDDVLEIPTDNYVAVRNSRDGNVERIVHPFLEQRLSHGAQCQTRQDAVCPHALLEKMQD